MSLKALLVLLLAVLAFPAPAQAAFPGQNGKIAFDAYDFSGASGMPMAVYTMNPDGSGEVRLRPDPEGLHQHPAWAPDGRKLATVRAQPFGSQDIYMMREDGSGVTLVTSQPFVHDREHQPHWSPDGQRIAFHEGAFPLAIMALNVDGSGRTTLTSDTDSTPAWSPDGSTIAFTRKFCETPDCESYHFEIWSMTADGDAEQSLILNGADPQWSPDGSKIAFHGFESDGSSDIYTANADGSGKINLTSDPAAQDDLSPAWSPDGSRLAFQRMLPGSQSTGTIGDIYVMNADGSGQTNLTNTTMRDERNADWQPIPHQSTPAPTYDHPRLAAPVNVSLVPNFRQTISNSQCTARGGVNSTHGPPLAFASCNPPGFVPGTIAHMGPASSSFATYAVIYGDTNSANGDQANMTLRASINDIRTSAGADYTPSLTLVTKLRITDRFNGGSQTDPATVSDFETFTPIACAATAGPEGASCNLDSSLDAQTPGAIKENKATVIQVFRFRVNDSGANGTRGDADDRTFAVQGIYIP